MADKECSPTWDKNNPKGCRFFGADPDGDYCGHKESLKRTGFGLSTNAMGRLGLCTHGDKGEYQLWEGKENG